MSRSTWTGLSLCGCCLALAVDLGCATGMVRAEPPEVLAETSRLVTDEYIPARIGKQWDAFLLAEIERARENRDSYWSRDDSSPAAYVDSISENRERFRKMIGVVDLRVPVPTIRQIAPLDRSAVIAESESFLAISVRWTVLEGVHAEGLLLKPKRPPVACVVVLPDADQTPEMLVGIQPGLPQNAQIGRQLAQRGAMVLIPTMIDRKHSFSGNSHVQTDQPHREWIYRQAADVGRHPIGYEVQKVQAAIDWFCSNDHSAGLAKLKKGVAGYGEGGLVAFYSAAIDERIDAAWVSGYFQPREEVWREPIYRNLWGLLTEFGDAEIASMVAPRGLVVEYSKPPVVSHPTPFEGDPKPRNFRQIAAPGILSTPGLAAVTSEFERAKRMAGSLGERFEFIRNTITPVPIGWPPARQAFCRLLDIPQNNAPVKVKVLYEQTSNEIEERQRRQVMELQNFTQRQTQLAEQKRNAFFWDNLETHNPAQWKAATQEYREYFWKEVIGKFPESSTPLNPKTRLSPEHSSPRVTTYEVVLDVYPDVITWGYLQIPTGIKEGERRPVVVCQHGAGGDASITLQPGRPYEAYATRLAERGFIVYSPYNPNRLLGEGFRQLQRKANPLKKSVFGIFAANHQRTLKWLKQLPFVDGQRIAFYGLSYGGKTAVRVPAVLEDYCLSICSGDWNDYLKKVTSLDSAVTSMMFYDSYENVQFNLGNTFNYAEMAALIAPRPFMVEHGYQDRVAPLAWAASEYSKVQELYFHLGIPERTEMEFFDGPHTIHGQGTFEFLHRHLDWPRLHDGTRRETHE